MLVRLRPRAEPEHIELHVAERDGAGVQLGRDGLATLADILDRATLPLEERQSAHAVLAAGVEWIRLAFEVLDLRLERIAAARDIVALEIRERDGERVDALGEQVG